MRDSMNKFIHSKMFMVIFIFVLIVLVGGVGTYAWFTWSSTNNTSLTLSIGKIADVTFDTGNNINTSSLAPVFNYTDGEMTTFSINNKSTSGATISYSVKLNITTISSELANDSLKYKLISNGEEVGSGTFSSVSSGTTLTIGTGTIPKGITDFVFYLYIDGNIENNSNMMNKTLTGTITVDASELTGAALTITNLYNPNTTAVNNNITYNLDNTNNLMKDNAGNIRYYGANPNNYVYFNCEAYPETNCELWRIIGVFDGKIKLIRNGTIGEFSWDTSEGTVNHGLGVNEWSQADLMKLLNPGYDNNQDINNEGTMVSVNNSLYYNASSGNCYNKILYNSEKGYSEPYTTQCDFTSNGLKNDTTRNMIEDAIWHIGGTYLDFSTPYYFYSDEFYNFERSSNVITSTNGIRCMMWTCDDTVLRTAKWRGKVALMYPSDYGFAADFTICNEPANSYSSSDNCKNSDWLYDGTVNHMLNPTINSAIQIWALFAPGHVNFMSVGNANEIRPTLYLTVGISITSGNGTESNPYRISA